jgi:hypothetical protein
LISVMASNCSMVSSSIWLGISLFKIVIML